MKVNKDLFTRSASELALATLNRNTTRQSRGRVNGKTRLERRVSPVFLFRWGTNLDREGTTPLV
ncbi:hypothetical protein AMTR_s00166p00015130 [Amborella trichopoda]|uniref:Uncharacterized protein n=1 Tax=Amborella trichopoda TaxID=13333 RepID=W1PRN2_AMBTC|nr:hypothetical protein AMTR_s00166p00015130 [Amborella trichopoda]